MGMRVRLLIVMALSISLLSASRVPARAQSTLTVQAGANSPDGAIQVTEFFPATLTVDVGDTVTWNGATGQLNTVTFGALPFPANDSRRFATAGGNTYDGNGFVSSGLIQPNPAKGYSLTFTSTGTFDYQSLTHPGMNGTIVVQPAGSTYPASQASYSVTKDPRIGAAVEAGTAALNAQTVVTKVNPDGTMTYTMNAGFGDGKTFGLARFGAAQITVRAGDTVVWVNHDPSEIHTVTFLAGGQTVPFLLPNGQINPVASASSGGTSFAGVGFHSSGILSPSSSYALTFTTAGVYTYACLIHQSLGMTGTITVLPAGSKELPPTGGARIGAVGLACLAVVGIGLALRHRPVRRWRR